MPLPNSLNEENRQPTKAYILETMQHWITVMQLRPGEKISDTEIAEYFNVSRTPVREVLKMLEQQTRDSHFHEMAAEYRKHFFNGCGQSFSCQAVCPAKLPLDEIQARANNYAARKL